MTKLMFCAPLTLVLAAGAARAETMECTARVALNRVYDISVDLETGNMNVANDAGTTASGPASKLTSGSSGNQLFFLATGFGSGIQVEIENGGRGRVALCLAANECYLCR